MLGAGAAALLAAALLKRLLLDVTIYGPEAPPYATSALARHLDVRFREGRSHSLQQIKTGGGPFDLIVDATGTLPHLLELIDALHPDGVLVMPQIGGPQRWLRPTSGPVSLSNRAVVGTHHAERDDLEAVAPMLTDIADSIPGWLDRLISDRVQGLHRYERAYELVGTPGRLHVVIQVAPSLEPARR